MEQLLQRAMGHLIMRLPGSLSINAASDVAVTSESNAASDTAVT